MTDNQPTSARLEEFQQRWSEDPTSRIFLQLAEEHRRHGQVARALEVLGQGLKHHPNWVSAQVALGRCRLEAGELQSAIEVLENVVRQDPTQMVAYRLLVEGYLQQQNTIAARERLSLYRQLNSQDPDVEQLEARIQELEARMAIEAAVPSAPDEVADSALPPPPPLAPSGVTDDGAETQAPAPSASADDVFGLEPPRTAAPNLTGLAPRPLRYRSGGPAAEARSMATAEDDQSAPPQVMAPAATGEAQTENRPEVAKSQPVMPAPPAPASSEATGPPEPPKPPSASAAGFGAQAPPRQSDSASATTTLGELYLGQGHRTDAEKIFRDVLDRDPQNEGARQGLHEASSESPGRLDVAKLLGESGPPSGAGLSEKKAFALRNYLERLNERHNEDVS